MNTSSESNYLKEIIQWDINSWSRAIAYWDAEIDWSNMHKGLELGGREGGLALWIALKGIHVVCSDLEGVEQTAKPLHEKFNVLNLVEYRDIDATNIPYENHFDVIVFKSILGGIGRDGHPEKQKKALQQIHKALKPGGKLLFAENLVASPLHQQLRKLFINWGSSWRYVSLAELESFLSDFSGVEIKTTGVLSAFGRGEGQRGFLAYIDQYLINKIVPKSWHYIGYGIATK